MDILYRHQGKDKQVSITHVPRLWRKDDKLLLILNNINVLMNESELNVYLKNRDDNDIITVHNFETTKKQEYDAAMQQYRTVTTQRIKDAMASPGYTLDILSIDPTLVEQPIKMEILPAAISVDYDTDIPVRTVIKTVRTPRKINIAKKIDKVEEGKILNVSKITPTGTGITTLKFNPKKNIFQTKNEYLESDNYQAFIQTIDLLPKKYKDDYKDDVPRAQKYFDITSK